MPISSVIKGPIKGETLKKMLIADIQDDEEVISFEMSITTIVDLRMGITATRTIAFHPTKEAQD